MPSTDVDGSALLILGPTDAAILKRAFNSVRPSVGWSKEDLERIIQIRKKIADVEAYESKRNATL